MAFSLVIVSTQSSNVFGPNVLTATLAIMKRLNAVYSSYSIDLSWMQPRAKFQLSGERGSGDIQIPIFCRVGQLGWSASADLPETWCEAVHEVKTHMCNKSTS